jgi:integrase
VATLKQNDLFPFAVEQYKARMDSLNAEVAIKAKDQELSEAEKAKYLEWPQILEAYERIRLAAHDLQTFQEYLIVSLYVLQPPVRLDYAEMRIVTEEPAEHGANYLVWNNEPYFLYTDYKTYSSKGGGAKRVPLSADLCDVIQEWRTLMHDDYLLIGANGLPMKEWDLGQTLIRTFEKHSGKSVGANILRHSRDSWLRRNEMTYNQSKLLANQMMHSQTMSHLYRRLT